MPKTSTTAKKPVTKALAAKPNTKRITRTKLVTAPAIEKIDVKAVIKGLDELQPRRAKRPKAGIVDTRVKTDKQIEPASAPIEDVKPVTDRVTFTSTAANLHLSDLLGEGKDNRAQRFLAQQKEAQAAIAFIHAHRAAYRAPNGDLSFWSIAAEQTVDVEEVPVRVTVCAPDAPHVGMDDYEHANAALFHGREGTIVGWVTIYRFYGRMFSAKLPTGPGSYRLQTMAMVHWDGEKGLTYSAHATQYLKSLNETRPINGMSTLCRLSRTDHISPTNGPLSYEPGDMFKVSDNEWFLLTAVRYNQAITGQSSAYMSPIPKNFEGIVTNVPEQFIHTPLEAFKRVDMNYEEMTSYMAKQAHPFERIYLPEVVYPKETVLDMRDGRPLRSMNRNALVGLALGPFGPWHDQRVPGLETPPWWQSATGGQTPNANNKGGFHRGQFLTQGAVGDGFAHRRFHLTANKMSELDNFHHRLFNEDFFLTTNNVVLAAHHLEGLLALIHARLIGVGAGTEDTLRSIINEAGHALAGAMVPGWSPGTLYQLATTKVGRLNITRATEVKFTLFDMATNVAKSEFSFHCDPQHYPRQY